MVRSLTYDAFKERVFDFENNEKWKFIGDKPAIIDFFSSWCQPCKTIAPILEELSEEYDGKIDIYKVNTEEQPQLAGAFGIQSIPSILFIPLSDQPQLAVGALPKTDFVKAIQEVLEVE